jgi:hypothetical protein
MVTVKNSAAVWQTYEREVRVDRDDQIVLAVAAPRAVEARLAIPRGVQLIAPPVGPDAADLALLGAWREDEVAERFERVVIASGDHIFAGFARRLRMLDVRVEQATSTGGCSAVLYRACSFHYDLRRPATAAVA